MPSALAPRNFYPTPQGRGAPQAFAPPITGAARPPHPFNTSIQPPSPKRLQGGGEGLLGWSGRALARPAQPMGR